MVVGAVGQSVAGGTGGAATNAARTAKGAFQVTESPLEEDSSLAAATGSLVVVARCEGGVLVVDPDEPQQARVAIELDWSIPSDERKGAP